MYTCRQIRINTTCVHTYKLLFYNGKVTLSKQNKAVEKKVS